MISLDKKTLECVFTFLTFLFSLLTKSNILILTNDCPSMITFMNHVTILYYYSYKNVFFIFRLVVLK